MSFINITKSKGLNTEPRGTPLNKSNHSEDLSPIIILCFRLFKKSFSQMSSLLVKQYSSIFFDQSPVWDFIEGLGKISEYHYRSKASIENLCFNNDFFRTKPCCSLATKSYLIKWFIITSRIISSITLLGSDVKETGR